MSDAAEKRFDATPTRRERAKRDGNSARSSELCGAASFAASLAALASAMPWLASTGAGALRAAAVAPSTPQFTLVVPMIALALVPAVAAAAGAIVVTALQTGGVRLAPLHIAFGKLAPQTGLKRMFGGDAAIGAARALIALALALVAVVPATSHVFAVAMRASSPLAAAEAARDGALAAGFVTAGVGALFGLADYALVRRRWLRSLRMTFDAFKRDMKEQDGDPQARSRRRQLHRAIARGGIGRTREASFVVVNPTHVAVALRYAPPRVAVPEIVVRAVDDAALTVRRMAQREGIPLVENVALARWLFRIGENGQPIPTEAFVAVAEVIAALVRAGALEA